MKYVGYYRVSTKKQSKSGLGLEAQQQLAREFARVNGELIAEFVEVESGRKDQRSELARAMNTAKKTGASLLIARLDRFSRRVSFIATMMEKGVPLVVAEMPNATDFQLHIFAALAQEERRLISVRTKAALQQARERGTELGKNGRALGEKNRRRANRFAALVASEFPTDWQTLSYSAVARDLNARGIRTSTGKQFHPQTVKAIKSRLFDAIMAHT